MKLPKTFPQKLQLLDSIHEHCININTREIFLHGHISYNEEEPGVEFKMANQLIKNLLFLDNISSDSVLIHLNTTGGDWHAATTIYDIISQSRCPITMIGYGSVDSSSSIILQAADIRILSANASFMIHDGAIIVDTDSTRAASAIAQNDEANNIMLDIYTEVCHKTGAYFKQQKQNKIWVKKYIEKTMKERGDWYMSSSEAVEYGFADAILGDEGYENIYEILNE